MGSRGAMQGVGAQQLIWQLCKAKRFGSVQETGSRVEGRRGGKAGGISVYTHTHLSHTPTHTCHAHTYTSHTYTPVTHMSLSHTYLSYVHTCHTHIHLSLTHTCLTHTSHTHAQTLTTKPFSTVFRDLVLGAGQSQLLALSPCINPSSGQGSHD